ncbi:LuxR C-terminal-related transcriptional regulator [Microbacterium pygmaeum]|uniref:DNA-binding transcriptional regulator, CsgD family n=1 Tax=Microbacterium pygmaeum TaxID=370764 RepID=A0A1G8DQS7_9MICO|nr:LuxR C-terminal-related transcriptional regulator [Microbacterium pygmaeum]SDH60056.1 DNA-binding transcriptional regulator, CsgD family [Microbacterium pygmaeum]
MPTAARPRGAFVDVTYFTGANLAASALDAAAIDAGIARIVISGNARAGKTAVLRRLQFLLDEHDTPWTLFRADTDLEAMPSAHVLLVDDVHLLDEKTLRRIRARGEDPSTGLVVAGRPWPKSQTLTDITRSLERSQPAIVLGQVSRSDVLDYLDSHERQLSPTCLDLILRLTGGVSWLVSAAISAHDDRDCADDPTHASLAGILEQSIAHRIDAAPADLRQTIETLSFDAYEILPTGESDRAEQLDDLIAQGYSEGLLLRNGQTVPVVRSAVRAAIPTRRLVGYITELGVNGAGIGTNGEWLTQINDRRLGAALAASADALVDSDPRRAEELYALAVSVGTPATDVAANRARAAWARGDLDSAALLVDAAMSSGQGDDPALADTGAATWSARGMLEMGSAFYRAIPPSTADARTRALIAQIGVGRSDAGADADIDTGADVAPTTVHVAMELLGRGLRASLRHGSAEEALADLVRASHLYSSSHSSAPIPEIPAVIATIVAINLGDLTTARSVIEAALEAGQGGQWARPRLLLWRAWVSMLRVRPAETRDALADAMRIAPHPSPRDDLMVQALQVAIARRWEDTAALKSAWDRARDSLQRIDVDLFTLHPLAEFVSAAARLGDDAATDTQFAKALAIVESIGSPAVWATQLRWSGIQHGILVNRPDTLGSHARALVEAAPVSSVAATMASAGRTWSSVLAGSADVDAVEKAAQDLAAIGLAWDAARLAGYGANQSSDRKVSARLLARARELHPQDSGRTPTSASEDEATLSLDGSVLSDREVDVARLVIQGKTYAEIGETIFISPRTAEHHIASIRRRLGATSRSDLIAKLRVALQPATGPIPERSGR